MKYNNIKREMNNWKIEKKPRIIMKFNEFITKDKN